MKAKGTLKIIGICVALQIVQTIYPEFINYQALVPERFTHLRTFLPAVCELIMYQLSHGGWAHLLGNFSIGLPAMLYVEHVLGERKMLEAFILSGLASAFLFMAMPIGGAACIGSSGSVFGMLVLASLLLGVDKPSKLIGIALLLVWLVPQLIALQMDFLGSVVAHSGHVGGALGGLLLHYFGYARKE